MKKVGITWYVTCYVDIPDNANVDDLEDQVFLENIGVGAVAWGAEDQASDMVAEVFPGSKQEWSAALREVTEVVSPRHHGV